MKRKAKTSVATYHSPPGATLRDILHERGMSLIDLAKAMNGFTVWHIKGVLNGNDPITPELASELEKVFGTPASFWIAREKNYRQWLKEKKNG